jgi:uncharacterized protein (DUF4415 family)
MQYGLAPNRALIRAETGAYSGGRPATEIMRKEYDFSQTRKNPYARKLQKKQITIRIEVETIEYFKQMAEETGIPYQNLINLFLRDCAEHHKKPAITWEDQPVHR